jgi:DNA mismatch repair protein MutS2
VDDHSLRVLEFDRVTASVAAHAACDAARARLAAWRPLADGAERARETRDLAEAIAIQSETGDWCEVGRRDVLPWFGAEREEPFDGESLVAIREWLEAGESTFRRWEESERRSRCPGLWERIGSLPDVAALRKRLAEALEPDGRVADGASPALARQRSELGSGERALEQRLTAWSHEFGDNAYVTRHGDRFVALVPAAIFSRRRGIVHDVSGSGQSLFVEPLEACEANNRLIELRAGVAEEERRVIHGLGRAVWDRRTDIVALLEVLVGLDTLRARARWAARVGGIPLAPGSPHLKLRGARHPLLALSLGDGTVPLDLELGPERRMLLVSGPNMGGKTVLLKTTGLAVALAHAAFPVPAAEGSAVPEIDRMVVDLGDEQSVDLGLSTFAAHLARLAEMAEAASPRALALADELGAGTDPEEGAALGRALIEHLVARRAWGVMTTHLGSLKRVAGEVEGVVNGSMEFDLERLSPRYRFVPGIPGASHALSVAERMGFPRDLLERARANTKEETRALERLIEDLHRAQRALEAEHSAARAAQAACEAAADDHRRAAEASRQGLAELRRRLTSESEALLARARELWQMVQREARRADKSRAGAEAVRVDLESVEQGATALHRELDRALPPEEARTAPLAAIAPGQRVRVTDLGVDAEVVSTPDAEGKVMLRRGDWTIHSHLSRLAPCAAPGTAAPAPAAAATWERGDEAPALEIDLRGMEVDEALRAVDAGLDRAVMSGLGELRIVHGIGRGILRAAVERHLRGHPQVRAARLGQGHEGGRGATVAELR